MARMTTTPRLQRRTLFSLAGASLLVGQKPARPRTGLGGFAPLPPGTILASPLQDLGPALNVAGPLEGDLGTLARLLAPPLAAGLMQGGRLELRYRGGADGVTGVNQFEARAAPDGREALLFPGSVTLDRLAGLRPVRFDCAGMLPLLAAIGTGVLMGRGEMPAPGGNLALRLATPSPGNSALVALLGLDLLGIPAIRVARAEDANAAFLCGPQAAARTRDLLSAGYTIWRSTHPSQAAPVRTPFFLAGVSPARMREDDLVAGWRAMANAATVCAALVLPRLSPAAAIGRWRHAAGAGMTDGGVVAQVSGQALQLVFGDDAAAALAPTQLSSAAQIALRRWIASRADVQRL